MYLTLNFSHFFIIYNFFAKGPRVQKLQMLLVIGTWNAQILVIQRRALAGTCIKHGFDPQPRPIETLTSPTSININTRSPLLSRHTRSPYIFTCHTRSPK